MKIIYPKIIIEGEKGAHGLDFTVLLYISWTKSFEKEKMITFPSECATALGMEKKVIPDYAITASTEVRATEKKLLLQIEDHFLLQTIFILQCWEEIIISSIGRTLWLCLTSAESEIMKLFLRIMLVAIYTHLPQHFMNGLLKEPLSSTL